MIDQQRHTTFVFPATSALSAVNDKCKLISNESTYLRAYKAPLQLSIILYKSALFMQNKPNFKKSLMNATICPTGNYENNPALRLRQNKANFKIGKININPIMKRNYEDYCLRTPPENKPNQTQSVFLPRRTPRSESFLLSKDQHWYKWLQNKELQFLSQRSLRPLRLMRNEAQLPGNGTFSTNIERSAVL
jgi:hypothetical protein